MSKQKLTPQGIALLRAQVKRGKGLGVKASTILIDEVERIIQGEENADAKKFRADPQASPLAAGLRNGPE